MENDPKIENDLERLIKEKSQKKASGDELTCAKAFEIVELLNVPPSLVGELADKLKIRLTRCSLGLFGFQPEKRRVEPDPDVSPELKDAIESSLEDGRLPCVSAWRIASDLDIPKPDVANACEALEIKISDCQLGAF